MRSRQIKLYISLTCIVLIAGSLALLKTSKASDTMKVVFFDVGQGDAIYVRSPTGTELLIDAGRDKKILSRLGQEMRLFDRKIDIVLATHPDLDHIGGLPSVLERYQVDLFIDSGARGESAEYNLLQQKIIAKRLQQKMQVRIALVGQKIDLGGGAVLSILYPNSDTSTVEDTNSASIIALLNYKKNTFLLTGDAPTASELKILNLLPSDLTVLKLGHHGSLTSTSFELLEKTTPQIAIVSAGKDNSYGHPHPDVMRRVEDVKAEVYRTDLQGTIRIMTDGNSLSVATAK